jgi:xanthine dehydrogenase YagR molybdenum-binding subunit
MADQPRKRFVTTRVEVEGREEIKVVELPSRDPRPWDDDASLSIVGTNVPRMDALEKVTGRARYTADMQRPGMLYAAILRAPVPRGRVKRIDLEAALRLPGVRGSLLAEDLPDVKLDGVRLLDRTIHYVYQPLAAICADSQTIADRALAAIECDIEPAQHAVTVEQALAPNAPPVRASGNRSRNSPRRYSRGDVDAGLAKADVVVRREFRTPVALHTALEPHGAVAEWEGGRVTIWESTQGIFNTRSDIADAFELPLSSVRVIKNYMGGGFGAKNGASHATHIAVALARKLHRPVRCVLDREGEQTDAGNRPATIQHVTLAARRDGTLVAIDLDATIALGIGGWQESVAGIYQELYRCPNVRTAETFAYLNTSPMASFRAPGYVEGAFGLECAMDSLARELGMDPLELRLHNYADRDQKKGRPYSDKRLDECYRLGAVRFGWTAGKGSEDRRTGGQEDGKRHTAPSSYPSSRPPVLPSSTVHRRGTGMSSLVWGGGGGPPAYATVRINGDGSIEVLTGAQDLGTGARTVFAQIAAEVLGARIEDVRTILGDTERLPFASNSWGSITTASVGPAVRVAAEEAREALLEFAAQVLDASPDSLEARDGVIRACDTDRSISFADLCEKLGDVMISGHGNRGPNPDGTTISTFGAQFAEVEVNVETGHVRVLRIVSAHDSGRIVNPALAESQLHGGIIQGIGYALFEERVLDERLGVQLNPTMHDYKIPTISDIPEIDAFFIDAPDVVANHTGAKGLAEPPIIGVAPAIANAVANAIGIEVGEIPLTPWRVLEAKGRT